MEGVTGATLALERDETFEQPGPRTLMKVEAFVELPKFDRIIETLRTLNVPTIIFSYVRLDVGPNAPTAMYRGAEYRADFEPRIKLELLIAPDQLEEVIAALSRVARTRKREDQDKIIVYSIMEAAQAPRG